jgi:hypothetical protein
MSHYHISYDFQPNKDVFKTEMIKNNYYRVDFDTGGRGVYVNAGNTFTGETIIHRNPTFFNTLSYTDTTLPWNLPYNQGMTYPDRFGGGDSSNVIRPAVGIVNYYSPSGYQTNTPTNITGNEANYYQIDYLRVKINEVTFAATVGWESFLQPVGSLDFTSYHQTPIDASAMIPSNLMSYLSQYTFPLTGEGETLLIAVRQRSTIPLTDGATNVLWPESCLHLKKDALHDIGSVPKHLRLKIPVWTAPDIGSY